MSNRERIFEAIARTPGLSDRELGDRTRVSPHQQVNQITNGLARDGRVRRLKGADGVWRNYAADAARPVPARRPQKPPVADAKSARRHLGPIDEERTLVVIPCSGRKRSGGTDRSGPSILDHLPLSLADALQSARAAKAQRANLDETRRLPAWRRYTGHLYGELSREVTASWDDGAHVLIISGAYGIVLAQEPIGDYDAIFKTSRWEGGLASDCLAAYAAAHGMDTVVAFAATTTDYAKAIRATDWRAAGVSRACLVTPVVHGGGAMARAPRALGQAINAAWRGDLSSEWRSTLGDRARITGLHEQA